MSSYLLTCERPYFPSPVAKNTKNRIDRESLALALSLVARYHLSASFFELCSGVLFWNEELHSSKIQFFLQGLSVNSRRFRIVFNNTLCSLCSLPTNVPVKEAFFSISSSI